MLWNEWSDLKTLKYFMNILIVLYYLFIIGYSIYELKNGKGLNSLVFISLPVSFLLISIIVKFNKEDETGK